MDLAVSYWTEVAENMTEWQAALEKRVSAGELREQSVHAHGVFLQAMGHVGADLISQKPKAWATTLKKLSKIDFARANKDWEGRAMVRGRISKARSNVILTGNYIKQKLGLPLTEAEIEEEEKY